MVVVFVCVCVMNGQGKHVDMHKNQVTVGSRDKTLVIKVL